MMIRWVKIAACLAVMIVFLAAGLEKGHTPVPLKIDYPAYFGNRIFIPDDNPTTAEGVHLGRMLFHETALSANNKISCATCHQQARAFTDGKVFSTGVDGTLQSRNTMSLANLLWVRNFFWDGRAAGLEAQAVTPLTSPHEMGQSLDTAAAKLSRKGNYTHLFGQAFGSDTISGKRIVQALSQFERTLVSADSRYDRYLRGEYRPTAAERQGIALFYGGPAPAQGIHGAGCAHCHAGPRTFNELFHNNGLDSLPKDAGREKITGQAYDRGRFRVVSLRNIALTAPYMHDGRFGTLEEVITHYNEHLVQSSELSPFLQDLSNTPNGRHLDLTPPEKKALLAFLDMLTDSTFITDKRFSDPFINH